MAVFNNEELTEILRQVVGDYRKAAVTDIPLTRPQIWAAAQAIKAVLDSAAFRTSVSNAIDTATAPATMTNAQKKRLFGRVIEQMFGEEVA